MFTENAHLKYFDFTGPMDLIGDIHGCFDEMVLLLKALGYEEHDFDPIQFLSKAQPSSEKPYFKYLGQAGPYFSHPEGRRAVFLGDIVSRGPKILDSISLVMRMQCASDALCILGNHEVTLRRILMNQARMISPPLQTNLDEINGLPEDKKDLCIQDILQWVEGMDHYYILDEGKLLIAHAGLKESFHGSETKGAHSFCLYGDTTGKLDDYGFPERRNWALQYSGSTKVIYGHTPLLEAEWLNNTLCLDTAGVFGGKFSALRYPENEIVQVYPPTTYCERLKPLGKILEHQF
ncbi:MAG: hypothetical protein K2X66_14235 [Cyanobacteria bacterium]|nr:hypothetical protein [Cyanobacteriota bacterium]